MQELFCCLLKNRSWSYLKVYLLEVVSDNSGALENIFDKEKVQAEIDLQVKVTQ